MPNNFNNPDNIEKDATSHIERVTKQAAEARAAAAAATNADMASQRMGMPIASGNDAMAALMNAVGGEPEDDTDNEEVFEKPEPVRPEPVRLEQRQPQQKASPSRTPQAGRSSQQQSEEYNAVMNRLREKNDKYNEIMLPSCGYFNPEIPNGILRVRPLKANDELEMASAGQRSKRGGDALDKIFRACVAGNIDPSRLCNEDRFFLLIYLRGISLGTDYEVAIKCPECGAINKDKIDLDNDLFVMTLDQALDSEDNEQASRARQLIKHKNVEDEFPGCGEKFTWGIMTGKDDAERDARSARISKITGRNDSKLLEHYSNFVLSIGGVTDHKMKQSIIKELPMADTAYLRDIIGSFTFGVDQNFEYTCQECAATFKTGLPIDESFFSISRTKKR